MPALMPRMAVALLLTLYLGLAVAENSTRAGGYAIHHNAMTTDTLLPSMARRYGIARSGNRGMINISVIEERRGTTGVSVPARVEVTLRRLIGRKERVPMREIRDRDAIYYIGLFGVVAGERVDFDISVIPEGRQRPLRARLTQEFYPSIQ